MIREINFDMDGTIADLYGCSGWLEDIIAEDTRPYEQAKPLVNMSILARLLNKKIAEGYKVNIISWTAKNGSEEYNARVEQAKREWLARHLKSVRFSAVKVLPYGTPKQEHGCGVLFDDEEQNRTAWFGTAFDEKHIIEELKKFKGELK